MISTKLPHGVEDREDSDRSENRISKKMGSIQQGNERIK